MDIEEGSKYSASKSVGTETKEVARDEDIWDDFKGYVGICHRVRRGKAMRQSEHLLVSVNEGSIW